MQNGETADERIEYEEFIVFADGNIVVAGLEKHNSCVIESDFFHINEVDDSLNGFELYSNILKNKKVNIRYCKISNK